MESGAGKGEARNHERVIRDSFTLPANDYGLLSSLRERGLKAGVHANKSELVRAGLRVLAGLNDKDLIVALEKVEKIKTGRPTEKTV